MKFVLLLITALFVHCGLFAVSFAAPWQAPIMLDGATPVTAEEAMDLINQMDDLVLIDTRKNTQYKEGTIQGSVSLPNPNTSPRALANVVPDKFTPVLFYCDGPNCSQSLKSIKKAVSYGYVNIFWLRGGVSEWLEKGYPMVQN